MEATQGTFFPRFHSKCPRYVELVPCSVKHSLWVNPDLLPYPESLRLFAGMQQTKNTSLFTMEGQKSNFLIFIPVLAHAAYQLLRLIFYSSSVLALPKDISRYTLGGTLPQPCKPVHGIYLDYLTCI